MPDASQLARRVERELRRAGLRAASFELNDEGGFAIQVNESGEDSEPSVSVIWRASRALLDEVFADMPVGGHPPPPLMQNAGHINHAMALAIIEILRSAGLSAQMSTDDMEPLTVEVLPMFIDVYFTARLPHDVELDDMEDAFAELDGFEVVGAGGGDLGSSIDLEATASIPRAHALRGLGRYGFTICVTCPRAFNSRLASISPSCRSGCVTPQSSSRATHTRTSAATPGRTPRRLGTRWSSAPSALPNLKIPYKSLAGVPPTTTCFDHIDRPNGR